MLLGQTRTTPCLAGVLLALCSAMRESRESSQVDNETLLSSLVGNRNTRLLVIFPGLQTQEMPGC